MKTNEQKPKTTCSACAKKNKNTSVYANYDAGKDVNENSRLIQMIDNTDAIECDK